MATQKYKTGETVQENGTYKVDSLVNGGSATEDTTEIEIKKGDPFPPSPSSNEAVYWVKVK